MTSGNAQRLIFLYPGQGAQHEGMGWELYRSYAQARRMFAQADDHLGFSLSRLCFKGPVEQLNGDLNAQMAVYTVSCIITDILKAEHILPDAVAGYSAGFYGAAYAAGCFDFTEGLEIVRRAGEILQEEGSHMDGGMAVIFGLPLETVEHICAKTGEVSVAIANTRRQIVVSGMKSHLQSVMERAAVEGALDAYALPVATAYHSPFVGQSGDRLRQETTDATISDPKTALFSYSSLDQVRTGQELREVMSAQLSRPVKWVDLVTRLRDKGPAFWVEIGPGTMLSRTVRWIDRQIDMIDTAKASKVKTVIERCQGKARGEDATGKGKGPLGRECRNDIKYHDR